MAEVLRPVYVPLHARVGRVLHNLTENKRFSVEGLYGRYYERQRISRKQLEEKYRKQPSTPSRNKSRLIFHPKKAVPQFLRAAIIATSWYLASPLDEAIISANAAHIDVGRQSLSYGFIRWKRRDPEPERVKESRVTPTIPMRRGQAITPSSMHQVGSNKPLFTPRRQ